MARFAVPMNGQTGQYEVHAIGCRDLSQPRKRADCNLYGSDQPETIEAADADAAADAALRESFSGGGDDATAEHPARDGYPTGSYGAAGFTARVYPCARKVAEAEPVKVTCPSCDGIGDACDTCNLCGGRGFIITSAKNAAQTAAPAVEPTSLWSQSDREHAAFRLMEDDSSEFAHRLARLWFASDATNKAKIRAAWGETIEEFAQRAAKDAR